MGCYDTFTDKDLSVQCKAFNNTELRVFSVGDIIPEAGLKNVTVTSPENIYIVIEKGKFTRLTENFDETAPPYMNKWGTPLDFAEASGLNLYNNKPNSEVTISSKTKSYVTTVRSLRSIRSKTLINLLNKNFTAHVATSSNGKDLVIIIPGLGEILSQIAEETT